MGRGGKGPRARAHLRVAPVALGVQIAELDRLLQAETDLRGRARHFALDEVLACTHTRTYVCVDIRMTRYWTLARIMVKGVGRGSGRDRGRGRGCTAARRLVVVEDAVHGVNAVCLAEVDHCGEREELGDSVRRPRLERRLL